MRALEALAAVLVVVLCVLLLCGAAPAPEALTLAQPVAGWQDAYLNFLDSHYDTFAYLWPDGMSGVGFVDLDLDGTPEMIVFDQGASATLGAQFFDLVNGQVYCVSSVLDAADGAFDGTYMSPVDVCTSFFESFRLSWTADGWRFWVDSANGTMETAWDQIVRFDSVDGVLTPVDVCYRYLEFDPDSGLVVSEQYTAAGVPTDAAGYDGAAGGYMDAQDAGYDAAGVFLWNDMDRYDTSREGLMAMARDAVSAYRPIADYVTAATLLP